MPVASSGIVHGAVRITYPSSTLDDRVRAVWLGLLALSAFGVVVVIGVGFALAGLVTRPVDRLKDAARKIAAGDLDARAPTDDGAPELRELATIFNGTAARLQEMMNAQQAFVGDASHQLRTPLAALRLQLENIESAAAATPTTSTIDDHGGLRVDDDDNNSGSGSDNSGSGSSGSDDRRHGRGSDDD